VYFAPDVYERLKQNDKAMRAVIDAGLAQPGVAAIFRAEQVQNRPATQSPIQAAVANGYFPGRSGDLFVIPNPTGSWTAALRVKPARTAHRIALLITMTSTSRFSSWVLAFAMANTSTP